MQPHCLAGAASSVWKQYIPPPLDQFLDRKWFGLLGFFVSSRAPTPLAVLVELKLIRRRALVLVGVVVPPLALFALKRDENSVTASHRFVLS
jgi:hypothetical protein